MSWCVVLLGKDLSVGQSWSFFLQVCSSSVITICMISTRNSYTIFQIVLEDYSLIFLKNSYHNFSLFLSVLWFQVYSSVFMFHPQFRITVSKRFIFCCHLFFVQMLKQVLCSRSPKTPTPQQSHAPPAFFRQHLVIPNVKRDLSLVSPDDLPYLK